MKRITVLTVVALVAGLMFVGASQLLATHVPGFCTVTNTWADTYTVCTDKTDYFSDDIVHITGSGFVANAPITLRVTWPDGFQDSNSVATDGDGGFLFDYNSLFLLGGTQGHYLIEVFNASSELLASHIFTDAVNDGTGIVSSVVANSSNPSACVVLDNNSGPDQWNVEEGKTYDITITGITECGSSPISVLVKNSIIGNVCVQNVPLVSGNVAFSFTMGPPACFTYPIEYFCSTNCTGDSFKAQDDDGDASHLRAATFSAGCTNPVQDETCTAASTTTTSTSTSTSTSTTSTTAPLPTTTTTSTSSTSTSTSSTSTSSSSTSTTVPTTTTSTTSTSTTSTTAPLPTTTTSTSTSSSTSTTAPLPTSTTSTSTSTSSTTSTTLDPSTTTTTSPLPSTTTTTLPQPTTTTTPVTIPAANTWGMVALGLAFLGAMAWMRRVRRFLR